MDRLTSNLLDMSQLESGKMSLIKTDVEIGPLIDELVVLLSAYAEERSIKIEFEAPEEGLSIYCDRDRVFQVIHNLLGNAIKFSDFGGTVSIRLKGANERLRFQFRNTGTGTLPDELPLIFNRFWRSKKTALAGSGLGLYISYGIIEAHGGRMWAESKVGESTTFYFELPAGNLPRLNTDHK